MKKEFIQYQQVLELKELGFDEPCFDFYDNNQELFYTHENKEKIHVGDGVNAPLYQQAFRWFREKYDLQCWPEVTGSNRYSCRYDGNDETGKRWVGYLKDYNGQSVLYSKYEEAELACLIKLISIVKEKL
jgi:hypothetical protein